MTGSRRWWVALAVIAVGAAALRVLYVMAVARHVPLGADATWYLLQSGTIGDGTGFVDPELWYGSGEAVATANFPPMYPAWLAVVGRLAGSSETVAQLAGAAIGAITVVLTALLARRVAGPTVALLAAAIAAVSPVLIAADGSLMSETLQVPLVVGALLAAHLAGSDGRWWAWVLLGACVGLAALTRTEAVLLVGLLVLPVLWWATSLRWRERVGGVAAALLVALAVVTPWMARNARELDRFTLSTVSPDTALAGASCDATWWGPAIGSWSYDCTRPELRRELGEEGWGRTLREESRRHVTANLGRLPVVLAARELRVWGLWDPTDQVTRDAEETRDRGFQWLVWTAGFVTLVGGIAGLAHLTSRRGREMVVLWAPVAAVAVTALVSHGNPRFRTVAEPVLAIGLAVTVGAVATVLRARRSGESPAIWRT